MLQQGRMGKARGRLSAAMAAALILATASPEAGHCVTACGPSVADAAGWGCDHGGPSSSQRDGDSQEHPEPATSCAGPTCLCHHCFSLLSSLEVPSFVACPFLGPMRPQLQDLGVVREVSHVPRHRA